MVFSSDRNEFLQAQIQLTISNTDSPSTPTTMDCTVSTSGSGVATGFSANYHFTDISMGNIGFRCVIDTVSD